MVVHTSADPGTSRERADGSLVFAVTGNIRKDLFCPLTAAVLMALMG